MMRIDRRVLTGAMAVVLSTLLAACLLMPGKFSSQLDVRKNGTFSYTYTGGIVLLPLAMPSATQTFTPDTCYNEETFEERPCTEAELATQKTDFETQRQQRSKSDAEAAKLFFGGIDPADPKAAEEIAERLRRQKGWKRVEYKGAGLFDVEFAISGKLDHDFVFPTIERFPMANAFVQISPRNDGTVRIDSPGFAPVSSAMAAAGMMQGVPGDGAQGKEPPTPADGTFTIRTDAKVLANNTEEGPRKGSGGQDLSWAVNARTPAAPMALLQLAQ